MMKGQSCIELEALLAWLSEVRADLKSAGYGASDADIASVFMVSDSNFNAIKQGRRTLSMIQLHRWISHWNVIVVRGARRWSMIADDRGVRIVRRQIRM